MLLLLLATQYALAATPAPTNPNVGGGGSSRRSIEAMFGRRPVVTHRDILRTRKRIVARPVVAAPVVVRDTATIAAAPQPSQPATVAPYVVTSSDLALAFHPAPVRPVDPRSAIEAAERAAVEAEQAADDEMIVHALTLLLS